MCQNKLFSLYLFQPVCLPLNIHGNINIYIYMEFILGI